MRPRYLDSATPRYVKNREHILGGMHVSKHIDLTVDQVAEALGGMERALEWFMDGATAAAERLGRRL